MRTERTAISPYRLPAHLPAFAAIPPAAAQPPALPDVCILLSTYNGADYLDALLASLMAQSCTHWVLYWRDDGSADRSAALVRDFAARAGAGRCVEITIPHAQQHLGIGRSYAALLDHVPPGCAAAFCDQDDVWLPDKLERALSAIHARTHPPDPQPQTSPAGYRQDRQGGHGQGAARQNTPRAGGHPVLYCSRQILTDRHLTPRGLSFDLPQAPSFLMALTQNIATGCTVVLSAPAVSLVRANMPPPAATLHDWWAYLLVSAVGGTVIADNTPTLFYRQHTGNAVGARIGFVPRAMAALHRGPGRFMGVFRANIAALLGRPAALMPQHVTALLLLHEALEGTDTRARWRRLRALWRLRAMRRGGLCEQAVFHLWFLLG
nr:glycosyltransferase [Acetobacter garciniae]